MDSIILPERWQKSNERQIYAVPTGLRKIWGAVISINMALLAELPAPDAIPLKTAKNQKKLDFLMATDSPTWFRLGSDPPPLKLWRAGRPWLGAAARQRQPYQE